MPHIVIEYSSNLRGRLDVEGFVKEVHNAGLATGVFPLGGTITRTLEHVCYRIADADPENAFIRVTMRIRPGRTLEVKRTAGEKIFAQSAITWRLFPARPRSAFSLRFRKMTRT